VPFLEATPGQSACPPCYDDALTMESEGTDFLEVASRNGTLAVPGFPKRTGEPCA